MSAAPLLDFEGVARVALGACPDLLWRWFPAGRIVGREFVVGDLHGRPGESLSINLDTGLWADFASTERGGDLVALYAAVHGVGQGEAAHAPAGELSMHLRPCGASADVIPMPKRGQHWRPLVPVPDGAPPPPSRHPKWGAPAHVAKVRGSTGALLHLILRFEPAAGRKQVVPLTYGTLDGHTDWHWKAPAAPRPLYGLNRLAAHPGRPVLVVEGEPKRDAAQRMLDGHAVVVSWPNGAEGVGKADWRPLRGRDVAVWPDADPVGRAAAAAVVKALRAVAASARTVAPPDGVPAGWDLADAEREGWTGDRVWEHVRRSRSDDAPEVPPSAEDRAEWPFRMLGHDRGHYFSLPRGGGQVVRLNARDLHNPACLVALAPLDWREAAFPGRESFNARKAGNDVIRACERAGVFEPDRLRGRGAWLDEGRVVLHLGDRMLVAGAEVAPAAFRSRFIYEAAKPFAVPLGKPLDDAEAAGLVRLCCEVPWEDPGRDGRLLAGWLVEATVCGALPWRPHLWVTSETGGGKTWVLENLVRPVLAALALQVQGKTTEAGLRGELRLDARPVVFDEAETQNDADRARMQHVLDLARVASSDDGSDIIKGTRDGGAVRYRIRSCFAFSSVNLGLSQAADESRTVVLNIAPDPDKAAREIAFERLKRLHAEVLKPDFPARLLARTLTLLPAIRANAEVLAAGIARGGVSRRTGDTLGVILACARSLHSAGTMTAREADEFLAGRAWVRDTARRAEVTPEWERALSHLMQAEVRLVSTGSGRLDVTTVGDLVGVCVGVGTPGISRPDADAALKRHGVRVVDGRLLIGSKSDPVRHIFASTPWAGAFYATISRAPGAKRDVQARFSPAYKDKCVSVPVQLLTDDG